MLAQDINMKDKSMSDWLKEIKKAYDMGEFGHELKELQKHQDEEEKSRAKTNKDKKKSKKG